MTFATAKQTSGLRSIVKGLDHIELYVGNVRYAAHYHRTVWGFEPIAYRGLETGSRDRTSLVLRQGSIVLVLTGAIEGSSPVAEHLKVHGEGIATVAFSVDGVEAAYQCALARGASPATDVEALQDADGELVRAEVRLFDNFSHVLVDRSRYRGAFWPGFRRLGPSPPSSPVFASLDHVAVCVEGGVLGRATDFYQQVFGFTICQCENITSSISGMDIRVIQNPLGNCKLALVEPTSGKRNSQVTDFLNFNVGPGIQHLALLTPDIKNSLRRLRELGVEFVSIPNSYYEGLESRVGKLGVELSDFRDLSILVDRDERGYLLQTFTRPLLDRPTMFFEVIERRGALGFGGGNIKALFEAVEREQDIRGTL